MSEDRQVEGPVSDPGANEPVKKQVRRMQEFFAGTVRSGPAYHPIFDKFESEHVTQFLENLSEKEKASQKLRSSNRWFRLAYVALGIGTFVFLTLLLMPDRSELYFQLLQGLGLFGSGFAGGYGFKSYQDRRNE